MKKLITWLKEKKYTLELIINTENRIEIMIIINTTTKINLIYTPDKGDMIEIDTMIVIGNVKSLLFSRNKDFVNSLDFELKSKKIYYYNINYSKIYLTIPESMILADYIFKSELDKNFFMEKIDKMIQNIEWINDYFNELTAKFLHVYCDAKPSELFSKLEMKKNPSEPFIISSLWINESAVGKFDFIKQYKDTGKNSRNKSKKKSEIKLEKRKETIRKMINIKNTLEPYSLIPFILHKTRKEAYDYGSKLANKFIKLNNFQVTKNRITFFVENEKYEISIDYFSTLCYYAYAIRIILGELSSKLNQIENKLDQKLDTVIFYFDRLPTYNGINLIKVLHAIINSFYENTNFPFVNFLPIRNNLKSAIVENTKEQKNFTVMKLVDWITAMNYEYFNKDDNIKKNELKELMQEFLKGMEPENLSL